MPPDDPLPQFGQAATIPAWALKYFTPGWKPGQPDKLPEGQQGPIDQTPGEKALADQVAAKAAPKAAPQKDLTPAEVQQLRDKGEQQGTSDVGRMLWHHAPEGAALIAGLSTAGAGLIPAMIAEGGTAGLTDLAQRKIEKYPSGEDLNSGDYVEATIRGLMNAGGPIIGKSLEGVSAVGRGGMGLLTKLLSGGGKTAAEAAEAAAAASTSAEAKAAAQQVAERLKLNDAVAAARENLATTKATRIAPEIDKVDQGILNAQARIRPDAGVMDAQGKPIFSPENVDLWEAQLNKPTAKAGAEVKLDTNGEPLATTAATKARAKQLLAMAKTGGKGFDDNYVLSLYGKTVDDPLIAQATTTAQRAGARNQTLLDLQEKAREEAVKRAAAQQTANEKIADDTLKYHSGRLSEFDRAAANRELEKGAAQRAQQAADDLAAKTAAGKKVSRNRYLAAGGPAVTATSDQLFNFPFVGPQEPQR